MVTLNKPISAETNWYQPVTDNFTSLEKVTRYDVQPTTQTVGNSSAETSIYSKSISAGDMGADGMLRLWMNFRYMHNAGGARTLTINVKFGGTTVAVFSPSVSGSASNFYRALLDINIANTATNSQRIACHHVVRTTAEADSSSTFPNPTSGGNERVINSSAIDTTSAQTLEVTVQWSVAPVRNPSVEMLYTTLQLLK